MFDFQILFFKATFSFHCGRSSGPLNSSRRGPRSFATSTRVNLMVICSTMIEEDKEGVRRAVEAMHARLCELFQLFLRCDIRARRCREFHKSVRRADKDLRQIPVSFLSKAAVLNSLRCQTRADRSNLAQDGFMLNLGALLIRVCVHDLVTNHSRHSAVPAVHRGTRSLTCKSSAVPATHGKYSCGRDTCTYVNHLLSKAIVDDCLQESFLVYSVEDIEGIRLSLAPQPQNFPSQVFFMTAHALHCGLLPCIEHCSREFYDEAFGDFSDTSTTVDICTKIAPRSPSC